MGLLIGLIRKDYPTTGVLKRNFHTKSDLFISIRKDYPTTGVLKLDACSLRCFTVFCFNQEGLPDYWGIETYHGHWINNFACDQEGLPDYWGIETPKLCDLCSSIILVLYQEGLPDYWGIETHVATRLMRVNLKSHQEGLPDYWGIETLN